jgi:transcriptional regulator with XRE-family HTH domain
MDGQMSERMQFHHRNEPRLAEPYHLRCVGLPNVYLLSGVTFKDDPDYGPLVSFADPDDLHHAIGLHIAMKPDDMTGDELRFLRKQMRMTQEALAKRLRVNVQTVANYEKGKTANIGPADPIMRVLYALHIMPEEAHGNDWRTTFDAVTAQLATPIPEPIRQKIMGNWIDDGNLVAA